MRLSEYDANDGENYKEVEIPEGVNVFHDILPRILILRMRFMPYLDASGEASIEEIIKICKEHHSYIIFAAMRQQPRDLLKKAGITPDTTDAAFVHDFPTAIKLAQTLMNDPDFVKRHQDI